MSRSSKPVLPWLLEIRTTPRTWNFTHRAEKIVSPSPPLDEPNTSALSCAAPVKLTHCGKKQKRAPDAAGSYVPLNPTVNHGIPGLNSLAMTNGFRRDGQESPSSRSASHASAFQPINTPRNDFQSAQPVPVVSDREASSYGPRINPNLPEQGSNNENNTIPPSQHQASQSNSWGTMPQPFQPFLPPAPFDNFDMSAWNSPNLNANLPFTPLPMPFLNPAFFDPTHMGSMLASPLMPFPPTLPLQNIQPMSTMAGLPNHTAISKRKRSATPPVKIPVPSDEYLQEASKPPKSCPQRPLLVILDMNGTLILRKHKRFPPSFHRRVGLNEFLDTLAEKYTVMIWSSSKPQTIEAVAAQLFPKNKKQPVALWGRDKFGLTSVQYNAKLQVYKELQKVWGSSQIQAAYPGRNGNTTKNTTKPKGGKFAARKQDSSAVNNYTSGNRWDQTNTILIDDSKLKALSEPYNILEIPEFTDPVADTPAVFEKILSRLDALSRHDDVSKVLREWNTRLGPGESILDLDIRPAVIDLTSDNEEGGVNLSPTNVMEANGNAPSNLAEPADAKETARLKKERSKARKQEKKAAKRAAKEAAKAKAESASTSTRMPLTDPDTLGSNEDQNSTDTVANLDTQPTEPQNQNPPRRRRRKVKKKISSSYAREFILSTEVTPEYEGAPRYKFRPRNPAPASQAAPAQVHEALAALASSAAAASAPEHDTEHELVSRAAQPATQMNTAEGTCPIGQEPATIDLSTQLPTSEIQINLHRRSISPVSASGSENYLLDRLEEALFPKN